MAQAPDTKPGNYYVSVIRSSKPGDYRLLAGPYRDNHQAALERVDRVRKIAEDLDPRACWYAFGTLRTEYSYCAPGILNAQLAAAEAADPQLSLNLKGAA